MISMKNSLNLRSLLIGGILLSVLSVVSCSTPRMATQLVHEVSHDTLYLSNVKYDSIYIYKDKLTDRSRDTLYIREVETEYKYRILRDTVLKVQHDSIPYEVTIVETKEITRPLTWFDKLCRICFGICLSSLLILLYKFIKHFWKGGFLKL